MYKSCKNKRNKYLINELYNIINKNKNYKSNFTYKKIIKSISL